MSEAIYKDLKGIGYKPLNSPHIFPGFSHEEHPMNDEHHARVDAVMAKHGYERLHNTQHPAWIHPDRDDSFHLADNHSNGKLTSGHRLFHSRDVKEGEVVQFPKQKPPRKLSALELINQVKKNNVVKLVPKEKRMSREEELSRQRVSMHYDESTLDEFAHIQIKNGIGVKTLGMLGGLYLRHKMKQKIKATEKAKKKGKDMKEGKRLCEMYREMVEARKSKTLNETDYNRLSDGARELVLHADNDSNLYNTSKIPVMKNAQRHYAKGVYDPEKGRKLWQYHADRAAHSYHRQHGSPGTQWHQMFPTHVRREAAAYWEANHRENMRQGVDLAD